MYSLTEENYIKAIYRISQNDNGKITPTAIASQIQVNAASVVDMIKKLVRKKLLHYDKVKGASLSDKGTRLALEIVRNHRLWEVFLLEKLGYSWDIVHDIAEQLEHIKHPELTDRLDKFLNFPRYDPHGDPIPMPGGELPETIKTILSDIHIGKTCRVAAVKDTSPLFLQYLMKLSVRIGVKIKVMDITPFDGSMKILIGKDNIHVVSKQFTDNLLVD